MDTFEKLEMIVDDAGVSEKALTSYNIVFTLRGLLPLVVRCITMEEARTTHDPV